MRDSSRWRDEKQCSNFQTPGWNVIQSRYDKKIYDTHMIDNTIESKAWGHGALAAEGGLEKSSFKFRSEDTDGFRLSNGIRKDIPDLTASGSHKKRRQIWNVVHLISDGWRNGESGMGGCYRNSFHKLKIRNF